MFRPFRVFRIRKEERWLAVSVLLLFVILNGLMIARYYNDYSNVTDYFSDFDYFRFNLSGFDSFLYSILTNGASPHGASRHPLVAIILYAPYLLNRALIWLIGINCAPFITAIILLFCVLYSFIFLYRLFREVIALCHNDAILLATLTSSFAYVLIAGIAPDHFALSMFLLIFTLYIAGKRMMRHKPFPRWQTILLFILTAGITVTNGIKVFIASWFVNGKKLLRPLNLLLVAIIPLAIMFLVAVGEDSRGKRLYNERNSIVCEARIYKTICDTTHIKDKSKIRQQAHRILLASIEDSTRANSAAWDSTSIKVATAPIVKLFPKMEILLRWIDYSVPFSYTFTENVFGESLILHRQHLLSMYRPAMVKYDHKSNYFIEAIIVALIIGGIWLGRRSKFLWLALSFFACDMILHVAIGFDVSEVYIMSPHWLFVFGIAIAYLFKALRGRWLNTLRVVVGCLAAYLLIHNVSLIVGYLT